MKRINFAKIVALTLILSLILVLGGNTALAIEKSKIDNVIKHGNVKITKSQMVKNVIVVGGKVIIAGTVKQDVVVLGGDLDIKPSAIIRGNIGVIGGKVKQAPEAGVTENIFNLELSQSDFDILLVGVLLLFTFMFAKYLVSIVLLLTSLLFNLAIPEHIKSIAKIVSEDFIKVSVLGILGLISFALLIIITALTIVGSIISILLSSLVLLGVIIGLNGLAHLIGERISNIIAMKIDTNITISLAGMIVIVLIWFVPILGGLTLLFLAMLGFGAIIYSILPLR